MPEDYVFKDAIFNIADIAISVKVRGAEAILLSEERHHLLKFISTNPAYCSIDVRKVPSNGAPPFSIEEPIFTNNSSWSLYRRKDGRVLWINSDSPEGAIDRAAILDADFRKGEMYCMPQEEDLTGHILDPVSYPFDQVLMISLIASGIGLMVHSCGIDYRGDGLLFVGNSGNGKTTMAKIWGEDEDTRILSDDRVIIRKTGGTFNIHGTPWHGTGKFAKPLTAPLKKIYFLKQAKENKVELLSPAETVARILKASFPPFWNRPGMEFTLDFLAELAGNVPSYELQFLPDRSVLDLLKPGS